MNEKLLKNLNNGINDLNPYKPGKPISEVMKEYGLTDITVSYTHLTLPTMDSV